MSALVVYESMYGNTAALAEAIAAALSARGLEASAHPVTGIEPERTAGIELLVVGGPTHAHGMSRASTRKSVVGDEANTYPEPTLEPGLREWLDALPHGDGRPAAAFDTRIDKPVLFTGSAARGIGRRLERRGYRLAERPQSFFVSMKDELVAGELERAATWATALAERIGARDAASDRATAGRA